MVGLVLMAEVVKMDFWGIFLGVGCVCALRFTLAWLIEYIADNFGYIHITKDNWFSGGYMDDIMVIIIRPNRKKWLCLYTH